jgi:NADH-quinone oxidoreductase E subunit
LLEIKTVLEKYPNAKRESLIAILQEVQDIEGFLSREAICQIGEHLKLPSAKVFGVATFYNQFRFIKPGVFKIQLCRGTACHVKGSLKVLEAVKNDLKIEPGQTTKDGLFSLEVVACIGACGLAPVVAVNGEFHASVTPEAVKKILNSYREKAVQDGQSK